MSFTKQFVSALYNNASRIALFVVARHVALEVRVWHNALKSNSRVNSYAIYIVVQIFVFKRFLVDIILFANNRDSFDIQV